MGCTSSKEPAVDFTVTRTAEPLEKEVSINVINSVDAATSTKSIKSANTTASGTASGTASNTSGAGGASTNNNKAASQTTETSGSEVTPQSRGAPAPRPKDSSKALSKAHLVVARTDFKDAYELGKEIGKGNYAVVHLATDRLSGLKVAVKIMERADLKPSDILDIKEEVSILMELEHPNIIKCYGFFEDSNFYYIVTELMGGGELFDEIVEREFYWERDAQEVVKMLADALDYMHQRGIVHRDLKPENVLLTSKGKDGTVKLADFGFAARTDLKISDYQLSTPCGTPGYVAPEIVSGIKYGREVDMWSLGVIAFILLGGYPPFHDDDQQELFRLIRRGKFSFDPTYWNLVSEEAKDCVQSLLTVDRSKRLKASDIKNHPWIMEVPETADEGNTGGGVGGRGAGLDGRGPAGSVNLSPALKELRKFQARRRWKDGMAIALAREGQIFGNLTAITSLSDTPRAPKRMEDITQLGGLGSSDVLNKLLMEKRARGAPPAQF